MNKWLSFTIPLTALLSIFSFFAYLQLFPVEWGSLTYEPAKTVTVYGSSQQQKTNKIASFTAGVSQTDPDKQVAIDAVNSQVAEIIHKVKSFGVADSDIQTQNISIHKIEGEFLERPQLETPQWRANNSIEITLRDATKAGAMAELLADTGATNVYGPNFRLDNTKDPEATLLQDAISDARKKAEQIANGSESNLGKILQVDETMANSGFTPVMMNEVQSRDFPSEPGSTTISKTVKVVFELL